MEVSASKFEPAGYRLLVEPVEIEDTIKQGEITFFVAGGDKKQEKAGQMLGVLRKVGRTAWPEGHWAKPGDKVYYFRYAGHSVTLEGKEYRLMDDTDIIGIIPEEVGNNE